MSLKNEFIKGFIFFMIPLDLNFYDEYCVLYSEIKYVSNLFFFIFYMIDFIIKMNSSYFNSDNIIINKRKIIENYFKGYLKIDLITILRFLLIFFLAIFIFKAKYL